MRDMELLKKVDGGGTERTWGTLLPVSARLRFHEQTITHLETEKHDIQERADHFRSQNEQFINEKQDLQGQVEDMRSQTENMQGQLDDSLAKIRRLAHLGKKEIDLADYERFLEGYAKLSIKELEVCKALASGLSTRQCAEQNGALQAPSIPIAKDSMKRSASIRHDSFSFAARSCKWSRWNRKRNNSKNVPFTVCKGKKITVANLCC